MYVFNGKLCAPCRASSDEPTATPAVRTERGAGEHCRAPITPRMARHNRKLLGVIFAPCDSAEEAASGRVQAVSTRFRRALLSP